MQSSILTDWLQADISDAGQHMGMLPSSWYLVSMAVVKIGDSILVRLPYEPVSMVLAKKSRVLCCVWALVVFLRGSNVDSDAAGRQVRGSCSSLRGWACGAGGGLREGTRVKGETSLRYVVRWALSGHGCWRGPSEVSCLKDEGELRHFVSTLGLSKPRLGRRRRSARAGPRLGGAGDAPARWGWGRRQGGRSRPAPAASFPLRGGQGGRDASPRRAGRARGGGREPMGGGRRPLRRGAAVRAANGRRRLGCARARSGEVEGGRGVANRSGARPRSRRGGRGAANGERRAAHA